MPRKTELTPEDQALRERFGAAIRAASADAGIKPQDVARIGGISLANQYRIEAGEATPDALYLFKVARHLSLTLDELLRGAGARPVRARSIHQTSSGDKSIQIAKVVGKAKITQK